MGRKLTEETRQKLREARARHPGNGMLGRTHSDETKAKMSAARLGKQRGEFPWWVGAKLNHSRRNAEQRGITWALTDDDARKLITGQCCYCGISSFPKSACTKGGWSLTGVNGIDRVNSEEGYTIANCVTCCVNCNRAKHEMTHDEFIEWLKRICSHLLDK